MEKISEFREWTIKSYLERINLKQIEIPRFQRGISWSSERQQRLIGSIRQGFPIGAILLAQKNDGGHERYSIIDGLQRTTAIRRFVDDPTQFIGTSDNDFLPEWRAFAKWISVEFTGEERDSRDLDDFLHRFLRSTDIRKKDRVELFEAIEQHFESVNFETLHKSAELKERANKFYDSLQEELDISEVTIPVILFTGPNAMLPEVFERLNSQGVTLSKYQIFAASWQKPCKIENAEILEAVKAFYSKRLSDASIEIEDIAEDGLPETLTLFDYLTGLGTVLANRYPLLFPSEWSPSIGFQIATVAHKLPIGQMNKLQEAFNAVGDSIVTDSFTDALIGVCEDVNRALRGRLQMRLNSPQGDGFAGHTAFQIATMVTRLLVEYYDATTWLQKVLVEQRRANDQMVRRWYLIDRVRGAWGNAGDSQYFRQVWETKQDGNVSPTLETLTKSTLDELERSLSIWFEEQAMRNDRKRKLVTSETKLVLRYLYFHLLTLKDEDEETFHIDHLVPVSWWKRFFARFDDAAGPINSIGNLCLMYKDDNLSKLEKLPFSWHKSRLEDSEFVKRCDNLYFMIEAEKLGYPEAAGPTVKIEKDQTQILDDVLSSLEETSKLRWSKMSSAILKGLTDLPKA